MRWFEVFFHVKIRHVEVHLSMALCHQQFENSVLEVMFHHKVGQFLAFLAVEKIIKSGSL